MVFLVSMLYVHIAISVHNSVQFSVLKWSLWHQRVFGTVKELKLVFYGLGVLVSHQPPAPIPNLSAGAIINI